jgi:ubiquitin-conjugating enzyme E2 O
MLASCQSIREPFSRLPSLYSSKIPSKLDPSELENRKRPQRFWSGDDLGKLTLVVASDHGVHVGEGVVFKDRTRPPFTAHSQESDPSSGLVVRTLIIKETRTTLDILWQDGSKETLDSKELIPYLNPDEYDCWYDHRHFIISPFA